MYQLGSELSVPEKFYRHVGVYIGNGFIFHNHSERGEEITSLSEFSKGRAISETKQGVSNENEFILRLRQAIANPSKYNLISRNCEHTVSWLRTGVASAPQLVGWATVSIVATLLGVAVLRSK